MDLDDPTSVALLAAEALSRAGIEHALYGGLLLAAYGAARETRDADLAVAGASVADAAHSLGASGETVLISDQDRVVAELVPPRETRIGSLPDALLAEAARHEHLTPAALPPGPPPEPPGVAPLAEILAELAADRAER